MNLRPKRLTAAYTALLDVLSNGRSMAVTSAVALAREIADVSERTIHAARARLPIECDRIDHQSGTWRLVRGDVSLPEEWGRRRLPRYCVGCGEIMPDAHWRRRKCTPCGGSRETGR